MFGISLLGWVHTLGSLPAIPAAAYMFAVHGRIVPRSKAGALYFVSMLIGGATAFLVAHEPVSYVIGAATLLLLFAGYAIGRLPALGRAATYVETIALSLTAFLLMVPHGNRNPASRPRWPPSRHGPALTAPSRSAGKHSGRARHRIDRADRPSTQRGRGHGPLLIEAERREILGNICLDTRARVFRTKFGPVGIGSNPASACDSPGMPAAPIRALHGSTKNLAAPHGKPRILR